jgi:hypothetical protein
MDLLSVSPGSAHDGQKEDRLMKSTAAANSVGSALSRGLVAPESALEFAV